MPYVAQILSAGSGPVVAALDYATAVGLSISPWVVGQVANLSKTVGQASGLFSYVVLGADGFGRSEARGELRRFFEIDAEHIALAALTELARAGQFPAAKLPAAIKTLGLDPAVPNPMTV